MNLRLIPRLDIKGPNLVKGIRLEGLRVLGKPEAFARRYYEDGADELLYVDAVASLYQRNSLLELVERTASEVFIPLCVAGGLRSVEDVRAVLRAGADKVAINTAAVEDPALIGRLAQTFGSSTVVVAIEAHRHHDGRYEAYTDYGREASGRDALEWASQVVELGAGELLVTSINREGTGQGFDVEFMKRIASSVSVPVIAHGGGGTDQHVLDLVQGAPVSAVCLASLLHYPLARAGLQEGDDYSQEGNVEFLRSGGQTTITKGSSIASLKAILSQHGLPISLR